MGDFSITALNIKGFCNGSLDVFDVCTSKSNGACRKISPAKGPQIYRQIINKRFVPEEITFPRPLNV